MAAFADKTCVSCGRSISWRKKWEKNWDEVRYCSDACRRRRRTAADDEIEAAIRSAVLSAPSIAEDQIRRPDGADREAVRRAARRLVAAGEVEIVQQGKVMDPSTARGAFQIRRVRHR